MANTEFTNSLINEKSPYLLQHAHNPVDWHAWNEETFALAKKENKPIFLSIGYSTCYWCHVMEREVFENEEIAKLMNNYFVNIKLDREERPDIDRVYMTALQAMTGSGGWPMSMFLTPDLKPFYGATYIPPRAKYGRAGFEDVIKQIHDAWLEKKDDILNSSEQIVNKLNELINKKSESESELSKETLSNAFSQIQKIYDEENGGFGQGNKFPRPSVYNFLLDYYFHTKDYAALDIVTYSLKKMYEGGIYDHLSGGFHRYSVDHFWRVPHFEKMLYDQAQLIVTYLNTYQITKNKFYLFVAEDTAAYVIENLMNSEGGFYSAEDAESAIDTNDPSKKAEGAYYLWGKNELENILGKEDSEIFEYFFGIMPQGNTVSDPHQVFGKKNILYIANDIYDTARKFEKTPEEIADIIDNCRTKLLVQRFKRPRPSLDDKILTSWNGLMLSALAKIFSVTQNNVYSDAAQKTVEFIQRNLYKNDSLLHRFRDHEAKYNAALEDYAFLIQGLLDLYESTFNFAYLEFAIKLNKTAFENFYDKKECGFFDVPNNSVDVLLKTKDTYDGVEPAGNSVQIMNLLRIGYMTDNKNFIDESWKSLKFFSYDLTRLPFSSPQMLCSLSFFLYSPKEIILSGNLSDKKFIELRKIIDDTFVPNKILFYAAEKLAEISEFISGIVKDMKKTEVYVCENYVCNLPTEDAEELKRLLSGGG